MKNRSKWDEILNSPQYFLSSVSSDQVAFEFIESSRAQLSEPSFIDGRVPLSLNANKYRIPIRYCLDWHLMNKDKSRDNNFIFHMGFCGSTLMARLLDIESICFSYKEPQAIVQASELSFHHNQYLYQNSAAITDFILCQYRLPFSDAEINILKPSNWVNSMIPELISSSPKSNAVFISIDIEDFLIAVLRGGESRIQYVVNLLKHLNIHVPIISEYILKVEQDEKNVLSCLIKLVLLTHELQNQIFLSASNDLSQERQLHCTYRHFTQKPKAVLSNISQIFQLDLSKESITASLEKSLFRHSKVANRSFDKKASENINQQVIEYYGAELRKNLDWHHQIFH